MATITMPGKAKSKDTEDTNDEATQKKPTLERYRLQVDRLNFHFLIVVVQALPTVVTVYVSNLKMISDWVSSSNVDDCARSRRSLVTVGEQIEAR